ncbi:DUF6572 domain-containing protein [Pseudomonas kuykendallii]|uniref:DUF6572 domain-containing protein n=1 Tax=Pseudomonas kuykendallii TaxID=1007099 RepID=UPI00235785BE|nr:DUF6572 domain-containing protein [Pseudomonas kuykendallii]
MPLDNPGVIDLVSLSPTANEVIVHIVATEPWGEVQLFQLQEKLKGTVAFTADGQLERDYPEATGKQKAIEIRTDFPTSESVEKFISAARKHWCDPEGVRLSVIVQGSHAI